MPRVFYITEQEPTWTRYDWTVTVADNVEIPKNRSERTAWLHEHLEGEHEGISIFVSEPVSHDHIEGMDSTWDEWAEEA